MNIAHELAVLKTMAAELGDYVLAEALFWQMQASSDFPKLSLGMMLLTRARLLAADAPLTPQQRAERDQATTQIETTLSKWAVAAENKAAKELRSRLNLWQRFLEDCQEDPRPCADNYAQDVTQRAIAALLLRQFSRLADSAEAQRLTPLDAQLRARLKPGPFLWPAELQSEFPQREFWFLYGKMG